MSDRRGIGGRPPLPPEQRLSVRYELLLRPEQRDRWAALAEAAGEDLSEWIRGAAEARAERAADAKKPPPTQRPTGARSAMIRWEQLDPEQREEVLGELAELRDVAYSEAEDRCIDPSAAEGYLAAAAAFEAAIARLRELSPTQKNAPRHHKG